MADEPKLGNNVYIVDRDNSAEKFVTTTEAIARFVGRTMEYGADLEAALRDKKHFNFKAIEPVRPADEADILATEMFKTKCKSYGRRIDYYFEQRRTVLFKVWVCNYRKITGIRA